MSSAKEEKKVKAKASYNQAYVDKLAKAKRFLVIAADGTYKLPTTRKITGANILLKKKIPENAPGYADNVYDLHYRVTGPRKAIAAFISDIKGKGLVSAPKKASVQHLFSIQEAAKLLSEGSELLAGEVTVSGKKAGKFADIDEKVFTLDMLRFSSLAKKGIAPPKEEKKSLRGKGSLSERIAALKDEDSEDGTSIKVMNVTKVSLADSGAWQNVRKAKKTANMRDVMGEEANSRIHVLPQSLEDSVIDNVVDYLTDEMDLDAAAAKVIRTRLQGYKADSDKEKAKKDKKKEEAAAAKQASKRKSGDASGKKKKPAAKPAAKAAKQASNRK